MRLLAYIAFLALCLGLLYLSTHVFESEETLLSHDAIEPDIYLSNTKLYAQEHAYSRSLEHLDKAIQAIKDIEQELDEESRKTIDKALGQLELVYEEIRNDTLNFKDLNDAFTKALNALSYAELKVSEHYFESHETEKAELALTYGQVHIKNALNFTEGKTHEYEARIYTEIDSLIEHQAMSNDEIIEKLEAMLTELDTLPEK